MNNKKRVAIIGAGAAGLTSAKHAQENGLEPVIFEKSDRVGGLWSSTSTDKTAIWDGLNANISYYSMSFSDHPYPKKTSIIPSPKEVQNYLISYIERFNLEKFLRLNTTVQKVTQIKETKQWMIVSVDTKQNTTTTEIFDFLTVASGLHHKSRIPNFESMECFKGIIMHSSKFKLDDELLKNKKVLVIGGSYSASDISSYLVNHASTIVNIFRQPYLNASRLMRHKPIGAEKSFIRPIDFIIHPRAIKYSFEKEDKINFYENLFHQQSEMSKKNPALYFDEPPRFSISDLFIEHVENGKILTKKASISRFTNNGVYLDDGTFESADAVILCTGYDLNNSYLSEDLVKTLNYDEDNNKSPYTLYKFTFHPDAPNLAMIHQKDDLLFTGFELQARWVSLVFSDKKKLPSEEEMRIDINRLVKKNHKIDESYNILMETLATEIGCQPDFETLEKTDPELFRMLWFNPPLSCHFLLNTDKREYAIQIIKEVDAIANKTYCLNENSTTSEVYKRFLAENSEKYGIPKQFH